MATTVLSIQVRCFELIAKHIFQHFANITCCSCLLWSWWLCSGCGVIQTWQTGRESLWHRLPSCLSSLAISA